MRTIIVIFAVLGLAHISCQEAPQQTLTLEQAAALVFEKSHLIRAAEREYEIKGAEEDQVRLWDNPVLSVDIEDLGSKCDDETASINIGIEQLFELGGKRQRRISLAEADQCIAAWDWKITTVDKMRDLMVAFIDVSAAQEQLNIAEVQLDLAERALHSISTKVENGKSSALELKKAQISRNAARLFRDKSRSKQQTVRRQLASLWGSFNPHFDTVDYPFFELEPPLPIEDYLSRFGNAPEMERARFEIFRASLAYDYEKARTVPDVTLFAGMSQYTDPGCQSAFLGFSIPIPVADRNQGNILRAQLAWCQSQDLYLALERELRNKVHQAYEAYVIAYQEALDLRDSVLLMAEESFKLADASYQEGKFEYLDMLDARRTFNEVQQQYLAAATEYHYRQIELQRIVGTFSRLNFEVCYDSID